MKFSSPLYYCSECKLIVPQLEKLLFIEDNSNLGFCSEACIEDFHFPIIRYFEKLEADLRLKHGLQNEKIEGLKSIDEKNLVDNVLAKPSEVWSVKNELSEEIFTYLKHFEAFTAVIICKVYKGEGSFVFLNTKTRSREFLAELRLGVKKEQIYEEREDTAMDEEDYQFMQLLENKKSTLLAELLIKRSDSDISFEEFNDYEFCFQECLDSPDEVFESKDKEGDVFFVYIKSFIKGSSDFFYIISCLKRHDLADAKSVSVFPVLAFPTNDVALYSEMRTGKKIAGLIKN